MHKFVVLALATLSFGAALPDRLQAAPLAGAGALRPAAEGLGSRTSVTYCEYYDPSLGGWVTFWAPGPCLRPRAHDYDEWLDRYYHGQRYWRGRLHDRPWVEDDHRPRFREDHDRPRFGRDHDAPRGRGGHDERPRGGERHERGRQDARPDHGRAPAASDQHGAPARAAGPRRDDHGASPADGGGGGGGAAAGGGGGGGR